MTAERIDKISRYANGVYYHDFDRWELRGESFEDFRQALLLLAIENPNDSLTFLMSRYKYGKRSAPEAIPYKVENMTPFTVLTEGAEDENDLIEYLGGEYESENEFEFEEEGGSIEEIARYLYDDSERREMFLDYMYGKTVGGQKQRDMREKCFRHRFDILEILEKNGDIEKREVSRLKQIARELTSPPKVSRKLKDTNANKDCRAYYARNKEKFAERAKRRNEKKKQARQAENANSAKEI